MSFDEFYTGFNDLVLNVIDELANQFILPLPEHIKQDPVMVCFFIEKAYWYFIENFNTSDDWGTMKDFTSQMFHHVEFLSKYVDNVDDIIDEWQQYKSRIPTYGAIIINTSLEKVLLVKSVNGNWGFPKGKSEEFEEPVECAAREVMEEAGLDIKSLINENKFIQKTESNHKSTLYIVTGVNDSAKLMTASPYEITAIKWFDLDSIPLHDKYERTFSHVIPFMQELLEYVQEEKDWVY